MWGKAISFSPSLPASTVTVSYVMAEANSLAVFHCSCRTVPIWRLRCAGFWPLSVLWAQRKLDGLALVFDVLIWVLSPSLVCSLKQEAVGGGQN